MNHLYYIGGRYKKYYTDEKGKEGDYNKIDMTGGGGMGGSSWSYYTKKEITTDMLKEKFVEFENITGKKIIINSNFVTDIYKIHVNYDKNGELGKDKWQDRTWKCEW